MSKGETGGIPAEWKTLTRRQIGSYLPIADSSAPLRFARYQGSLEGPLEEKAELAGENKQVKSANQAVKSKLETVVGNNQPRRSIS
jgi:hypothetical protein